MVGEGGGVNRVYGKKKVARKDRRIYKNSKEKSQKKWTREKKRGRAGRERERERERERIINQRAPDAPPKSKGKCIGWSKVVGSWTTQTFCKKDRVVATGALVR